MLEIRKFLELPALFKIKFRKHRQNDFFFFQKRRWDPKMKIYQGFSPNLKEFLTNPDVWQLGDPLRLAILRLVEAGLVKVRDFSLFFNF